MAILKHAIAIFLLVLALAPAPAAAQSLEQAKADGLVGERIDGFLGLVDDSAPAAVRQVVDRINAERRQRYAEIAEQRDVPLDAVAKIAGEKLIERTPSGQFVAGADGRWRRK